MGLNHLTFKTETVQTSGGEFTVRGLTLPDVVEIFSSNTSQLSALFDEIKIGKDGQVVLSNMGVFALHIAQAAPDVASDIISRAADEDDRSIARGFVLPVTIDALEKIGRLTFATEGSAKKFMETIILMVRSGAGLASLTP